MTVKLMCVSHTPMMEFCHPPQAIETSARAAFARLADQVQAYDPELIVVFGPDHFNGFFYDMMPSACIGIRAQAAGDWDIGNGSLSVPENLALNLVEHVLDHDVDVAYSYRMQADHGITQPLTLLCGDINRYPTIPVFLNAAASPLSPCRRAIALGQAVGKWLARRDERILILGSGGLSHDPPTPQMGQVPPEKEEFLIAGRNPTPEARQTRQNNIVTVGQALSRGEGPALALNPTWDQDLMQRFAHADFDYLAALSNDGILKDGGKGGQEIRAWIAAFAALSALGQYQANIEYYEPIQEWIAGMGMMTAELVEQA